MCVGWSSSDQTGLVFGAIMSFNRTWGIASHHGRLARRSDVPQVSLYIMQAITYCIEIHGDLHHRQLEPRGTRPISRGSDITWFQVGRAEFGLYSLAVFWSRDTIDDRNRIFAVPRHSSQEAASIVFEPISQLVRDSSKRRLVAESTLPLLCSILV
jgi:hypothetical protein